MGVFEVQDGCSRRTRWIYLRYRMGVFEVHDGCS